MQYTVNIEKPSKVTRKLTITVTAATIQEQFDKQVTEVSKRARVKGFRPGHVPLAVVKQMYGGEVKMKVYENVIDESFKKAVKDNDLRPVSRPQIETPKDEANAFKDGSDLKYIATFEILPTIEVKDYQGLSLKKDKIEVTDKDINEVIESLRQAHAELIPCETGHKLQKGNFVDFSFKGALVTDSGLEERAELSGTRMIEIGTQGLIPGFEEEMIGLEKLATKTFRIKFPDDYSEKSYASQQVEFAIEIKEIKEKKLHEVSDDFAKEAGYDDLQDMKAKAREAVTRTRTEEVDRKLKGDILQVLIKKFDFEMPKSLLEAQYQSVGNEFAQHLKSQGFPDEMIKEALVKEEKALREKADSQVRGGLILDRIAQTENIKVTHAEVDAEIGRMAQAMQMEPQKLMEHYHKDHARHEAVEFRLREEATLKFLIEKAKIK